MLCAYSVQPKLHSSFYSGNTLSKKYDTYVCQIGPDLEEQGTFSYDECIKFSFWKGLVQDWMSQQSDHQPIDLAVCFHAGLFDAEYSDNWKQAITKFKEYSIPTCIFFTLCPSILTFLSVITVLDTEELSKTVNQLTLWNISNQSFTNSFASRLAHPLLSCRNELTFYNQSVILL